MQNKKEDEKKKKKESKTKNKAKQNRTTRLSMDYNNTICYPSVLQSQEKYKRRLMVSWTRQYILISVGWTAGVQIKLGKQKFAFKFRFLLVQKEMRVRYRHDGG
jgi:hypothetical protein